VRQLTQKYTTRFATGSAGTTIHYPQKPKTTYHINRIDLLGRDGEPAHEIFTWDYLRIRITFHSPCELKNGSVVVQIATVGGTRLLLGSTTPDQNYPVRFKAGKNVVDFTIPKLILNTGQYQLGAALAIPNVEYLCDGLDFGMLEVTGKDVFDAGLIPDCERYLIPMDCEWTVAE
jgi:hypothetical protein